jgi:hypothetical protein
MMYTIKTNDNNIDVTIKMRHGVVEIEIYNPTKPSEMLENVGEYSGAFRLAGDNVAEKYTVPLPVPRPRRSSWYDGQVGRAGLRGSVPTGLSSSSHAASSKAATTKSSEPR